MSPQKTYSINRPHRANDGDDDDKAGFPAMLDFKRKPYKQYEQAYTIHHIHFYISEEIGPPAEYADMVYRMSQASETDTIFIHLNSPGGHLETGIQIINAIQNTAAHVITVLESTAYSMGSLIFLAGDEMVVHDNCMMMFHNFNGGFVGKGNELTSELEATVKWYATLARNLYHPFLTEDELTRIQRGEDMWMQSAEVRKRLEAIANPPATPEVQPTVEPTLAVELGAKPKAKKVAPKKAPAKKVPKAKLK